MSQSTEFKQLLFGLVKQVKLDMEKKFSQAKIQITPLQYAILALLKNGEPTLNELALKLGVRPPSLVPPIDGLIKLGYVHRLHDKKDRRKIHITVTLKAKSIFDKMHKDHPSDSLIIAFHKLTKTKQKHLIDLLTELNGNLN